MADFDANEYLDNSPPAQSQSAFDANSYLGNEPGVGSDSGIDQRLAQYDKLNNQYGSIGQTALLAAEQYGQGLIGPIATGAEALASKAGIPGLTPQDQAARLQMHPDVGFVSNLAGFGTGAFFGTGEAGLLAKAGELATGVSGLSKEAKAAEFAAQGLGGFVKRGAAEVATLKATDEISKAINQDPGQTLGTAAINIGLGGILGSVAGVGGYALGQVGPLWKAYTQKAADEVGVGTAPIAAGEDTLTQAIQNPKEKESFLDGLKSEKDNAAEIREAGQTLGIPVSGSQLSASDYVQSMDSALSQSPTIAGIARRQEIDNGFGKIGDTLQNIMGPESEEDAFTRGQQIKDQVQEKVDALYDPLRAGYASKLETNQNINIPDNARLKFYDKLNELAQKTGSVGGPGGKAISDVAERMLSQNTAANLDDLISEVGAEQRSAYRAGNDKTASALSTAADELKKFQIKQIALSGKNLESLGVQGAEEVANNAVKEFQQLSSKYADFKDTLSELASGAKLGKKFSTYGRVEEVLDKIPNEKLVKNMFNPDNAQALINLQKKFHEVFDTVIKGKRSDLMSEAGGDSVKLLKSIDKLPDRIQDMLFNPDELKKIDAARTWIESLPKNVGPSGTPKGTAYMNALQGHWLSTIINNTKDFAIKGLLKFAAPAEIEANKATSEYINTALKGQKTLDSVSKAFFQTGRDIIPEHLVPDQKSTDKLKKRLDEMNNDQQGMQNIGGSIGHYLPQHAAAVGTMAATAQNYFNSLKPTQPVNNPLDKKPPLSQVQNAKYDRALSIAQQPLLVLQHAKTGSLQSQDVDTLNTLYPALRSQIVSKITENMMNHINGGNAIPYHQRQSLSMLLGSPLDSTLTLPVTQAVMKANGSQQTSQGPGQQAQHKASGKELDQINKVNQIYNTPIQQRVENKKA